MVPYREMLFFQVSKEIRYCPDIDFILTRTYVTVPSWLLHKAFLPHRGSELGIY